MLPSTSYFFSPSFCSGEISVDQLQLGGLLESARWLQIRGLYENGMEAADMPETPTTVPSVL
jgi:hypothetical protein